MRWIKPSRTTLSIPILLTLLLVAYTTPAEAHLTEEFVDWEISFSYVRFPEPPVFIYKGEEIVAEGNPTIKMKTGDILIAKFKFIYVGEEVAKMDLFWLTRLGLDFATLGRYVDGEWIGASSFEPVPGKVHEATIVLRAIRPGLRHLHVGVSIEGVGNVPTARSPERVEPGERIPTPILDWAVFTDVEGPVVEPLAGFNVKPFGELKLLEEWPWVVPSIIAQFTIGILFVGLMYWYGKRRGAES